ncbi:hypothetical protein [Nocardia nepalensis]|uniref:hypothetical protein n=1 Tax=Nocardia nepalensis TaxID=3375448 RepID=UPI003B6734BE
MQLKLFTDATFSGDTFFTDAYFGLLSTFVRTDFGSKRIVSPGFSGRVEGRDSTGVKTATASQRTSNRKIGRRWQRDRDRSLSMFEVACTTSNIDELDFGKLTVSGTFGDMLRIVRFSDTPPP